MEVKEYVLGFLFDSGENPTLVKLIEKKSPEWQRGKLNGIGGKVEPGENDTQAMIREFAEEAGVYHYDWDKFAELTGPDFRVACFKAFDGYAFERAHSRTEEQVLPMSIRELPYSNTIFNVQFLVPLALGNQINVVEIRYGS